MTQMKVFTLVISERPCNFKRQSNDKVYFYSILLPATSFHGPILPLNLSHQIVFHPNHLSSSGLSNISHSLQPHQSSFPHTSAFMLILLANLQSLYITSLISYIMQKLLLAESLLQRNVLALIKLILGSRTERRALIETLVVCDQMSSTFVSVQKRNVIVVQLLLRG